MLSSLAAALSSELRSLRLHEQLRIVDDPFLRADFPLTVAAIARAWIAGQRISDVLQLGTHDFSTQENKFLVVVVRRGKVMSMIPPYPLALPLAAWPATTLLHEVASARRLGRPFLFSQDNSPQDARGGRGSRAPLDPTRRLDRDGSARSPIRGHSPLLAAQRHVDGPSLPVWGSSFDEDS
jgi:hypothetical protein